MPNTTGLIISSENLAEGTAINSLQLSAREYSSSGIWYVATNNLYVHDLNEGYNNTSHNHLLANISGGLNQSNIQTISTNRLAGQYLISTGNITKFGYSFFNLNAVQLNMNVGVIVFEIQSNYNWTAKRFYSTEITLPTNQDTSSYVDIEPLAANQGEMLCFFTYAQEDALNLNIYGSMRVSITDGSTETDGFTNPTNATLIEIPNFTNPTNSVLIEI